MIWYAIIAFISFALGYWFCKYRSKKPLIYWNYTGGSYWERQQREKEKGGNFL